MAKTRPPYPPEFRRQTVELARAWPLRTFPFSCAFASLEAEARGANLTRVSERLKGTKSEHLNFP